MNALRSVLLTFVLLGLLGSASAHASLAPDSRHALFTGSGKAARLAMPLPAVTQVPTLARRSDGRLQVTASARYVTANWKAAKGRTRDRAMATLTVARRLRSTGPDPSNPRYRRAIVRTLTAQTANERYTYVLPLALSRQLLQAGILATKPSSRRTKLRRLISLDVQQDRDFQHVDGQHDWRQGTAWSAADQLPRASSKKGKRGPVARAASSSHPSGTITVQNGTSWGISTCNDDVCDFADSAQIAAGTANASDTPILVAADAVQCFASGQSGSNPVGFANLDPDGTPQPYVPGTLLSGAMLQDGLIPKSSGFAVTQPVIADDSIALASNNEVADTSGLIDGLLSLGWNAFATARNIPSTAAAELILVGIDVEMPIPSPGTIVSALLDIALFAIDNSCDAAANLMNLSVTEPGGALVSNTLEAQTQAFQPDDGECNGGYVDGSCPNGKWAFGVQLNPSLSTLGGNALYLNQYMQGYGVADNVTDTTGNNYIGLVWYDQNPCTGVWGQLSATACAQTPPASPVVTNATGSVNCGASNYYCPFPAASWPPPGATLPGSSGTPAYSCGTIVPPGEILNPGDQRTSPNGAYTLIMQTDGNLVLYANNLPTGPGPLWASQNTPVGNSSINKNGIEAGSTAVVSQNGVFGVWYPNQNTTQWATFTSGYPGAYVAVQNDGNVVLYSSSAVSLWASNTWSGTACPPPGT